MSSFLKRVAMDTHGYAGSILGPLRQKKDPHDRESSLGNTEPQNDPGQLDNLQSQPGENQSQTSRTKSRQRADEQPDSKHAVEGTSTLNAEEASSRSDTMRSEDDIAEHVIGPLSSSSHDDGSTVDHTVSPLSLVQKGTDVDSEIRQSILPTEPLCSSKSGSPDHTAIGVKTGRADQQHSSSVNAVNIQTENKRLAHETNENHPRIHKAFSEKHQGVTEFDTRPITTPAPQAASKDKEPAPRDPSSAHRQNHKARNSFLEGNSQSNPGLAIESQDPVVHIGQIDIIVEAPSGASLNKTVRPVTVPPSLNASASFLRKL